MFIIVLDVKKFNILFSFVKTFGLQTKYCSLTYLQKHECEMDGYCISLRYGDETLHLWKPLLNTIFALSGSSDWFAQWNWQGLFYLRCPFSLLVNLLGRLTLSFFIN